MTTEPTAAISFYDLLSISGAILTAFALIVWAFGKVLLGIYSQRMDKIDGKDGSLEMVRQHVLDTDNAHRETHKQLFREVGELRSRVDKVEDRSITEKEVRGIMAESLTPVNESMRLINENLGKMHESINKLGASVAILNDREEQRSQAAQMRRVGDPTE